LIISEFTGTALSLFCLMNAAGFFRRLIAFVKAAAIVKVAGPLGIGPNENSGGGV
jgi:hypothetical protein